MKSVYILIFSFSSLILFGNSPDPNKTLKAFRISEEIKIDGHLSEGAWEKAEKAFNFVQTEPTTGLPATFDTETFFLYDNNAVYIGAKLHDPEPKKILKELSLRDQTGNADNFSVFFDTYKSGLNGFLFLVTASGVQYEAVITNNKEDINWNTIWESAVHQDENGWFVEIKIPYSSLRFPSDVIQDWNVQFSREIRRFRESTYWSPVDPTIGGKVQQAGKVTNIENVKAPVRLSLTPYVSGYVNTTYNPQSLGKKLTSDNAYSAGLDLKYGINDAFTLDMTLIPDFGQVISDRQVLNLTPFEIFFDENRQFFTEGIELFNRSRLFYSRRIGGRPLHYNSVYMDLKEGESVISNPEISQLYNATKVSGRTSKGTGFGAFNAFVGEEIAQIRNVDGTIRSVKTNPLTNYNSLVLDQNLKNNSFVSIINTNVYRLGDDYDANVTGGFFNFKTKNQNYELSGSSVISQKYFSEFTELGHTYNISVGKISGNWTYKAEHGLVSDKYDPNDMGFLLSPNKQYYSIEGGHSQFKPKNKKLQQVKFSGSSTYSRLYSPAVFTDYAINLSNFILWKNRNAIGFNARIEPIYNYDYFEPRTRDFSRYMAVPKNYTLGGFISSDYRKPLALDLRLSYRYFDINQRYFASIVLAPRFRFSDKISIFTNTTISIYNFEPGYVNKSLADGPLLGLDDTDLLFGNRNRLVLENSVTGRFIFNAFMGINLRVRHYWDKVRYKEFGRLDADGEVFVTPYTGLNKNGEPIFDRNVNIFNLDLQFNWRFAPGSDIIFVWKNQILNSDTQYELDYFGNLEALFSAPQANSFSVRFLYFLDYLYLFPVKAG